MVESTINAQTRGRLKEERLAEMLRNMKFNKKYAAQIFNFFTDVPLQDVAKFASRHGVSDEVLAAYYERYIREIYPNPDFEEMVYLDVEETL
ncbi:MAG: hypothetical protein HPY58_12350 [Firmicutes bacterium]|nr:hypothetical protein [Bacillota bacterium]